MEWLVYVGVWLVSTVVGAVLGYRWHRRRHEAAFKALLSTDIALELAAVTTKLEDAAWSLGGRLRRPSDPPIYTMPPEQEKTNSCDDARIAWMDATCECARALRAAGFAATANKFFPDNIQHAHQPGLISDR